MELFHVLQHAVHGSVKWKGIGCPWDLCVAHLLQLVMATCHRLAGRGSSISGVLFHWQTRYCMGAGTFETWVFPHITPICCNTSQIPVGSREMLRCLRCHSDGWERYLQACEYKSLRKADFYTEYRATIFQSKPVVLEAVYLKPNWLFACGTPINSCFLAFAPPHSKTAIKNNK